HAKAAAGEIRVATALGFRRAFEEHNLGALFRRREGSAQRRVAASDHHNVVGFTLHSFASPGARASLDAHRFICGIALFLLVRVRVNARWRSLNSRSD